VPSFNPAKGVCGAFHAVLWVIRGITLAQEALVLMTPRSFIDRISSRSDLQRRSQHLRARAGIEDQVERAVRKLGATYFARSHRTICPFFEIH
jgi:hypothetical protein